VSALGAEVRTVFRQDRPLKERLLLAGRQIGRIDTEPGPPLAGEVADMESWVREGVRWADVVLISDYGKGTCAPSILHAAIFGARRREIPCLVDPARGRCWHDYCARGRSRRTAARR
jgi:bifunctional ADP-heptose synthase (sugar kinase/adenylyltransferase)